MAIDNKEPTHTEDGTNYKPGASSLTADITPTSVNASNEAWATHYAENQQSNRNSSQFPNSQDPYSPLELLINDAIQRYGNMSSETIEGSTRMMMLRYANKIVEDVRAHPYTSLPALDYYVSISESRPIPDEIVISGLEYHYAKWMRFVGWETQKMEYHKTMNGILYQRKYGSGQPKMSTTDKREE